MPASICEPLFQVSRLESRLTEEDGWQLHQARERCEYDKKRLAHEYRAIDRFSSINGGLRVIAEPMLSAPLITPHHSKRVSWACYPIALKITKDTYVKGRDDELNLHASVYRVIRCLMTHNGIVTLLAG